MPRKSTKKPKVLEDLQQALPEPAKKPPVAILEAITASDDVFNHEAEEILSAAVQKGFLWEMYGKAIELKRTRIDRYRDFDSMERDPLINSALELIVDDALQFDNDRGATIWADEKSEYVKEINDFLRKYRIEDRIWGWTYNLCKYGDLFPQIEGEEGVGITKIRDDRHPAEVFRIDVDGVLVGFGIQEGQRPYPIAGANSVNMIQPMSYVQPAVPSTAIEEIKKPWEFVHFICQFKPSFERYKIKYRERNPDTGKEEEIVKELTSMYGTSILSNSRLVFKQLNLLENSLILARLSRSTRIRIFYVNTQGMTPKERREAIRNLKAKFKKKTIMDLDSQQFDSDYNPMSMNDDLFIPITGDKGDVRAEELGGDVDIKDIVDLDYVKSKMFASLRIPRAYLGGDDQIPGSMGSTTLTRLDIRYARTVKKVQRSVIQGITRLIQIHLAWKLKRKPDLKDIKVNMVPVSGAEEAERLETIKSKLEYGRSIVDTAMSSPDNIAKGALLRYIFKDVVGIPVEIVAAIVMDQPQAPPPAGPEAGGPPGMGMGGGELMPPPEGGAGPEAGGPPGIPGEAPPPEGFAPPMGGGPEKISPVVANYVWAKFSRLISEGKITKPTLDSIMTIGCTAPLKTENGLRENVKFSSDVDADIPVMSVLRG
jgi:hypothetical protein